MSRRYRGKNSLSSIIYNNENTLIIKVPVAQISYLQKIMECYENLVIIIPLLPQQGLILLHTTASLRNQLLTILKTLHFPIEIMKNFNFSNSHSPLSISN
ncbi:MAG: DUF4911 domain-containing protein [Bacillota bacterium]